MECGKCGKELVKSENLCFYIKQEKEVHLTIQLEKQDIVLSKETLLVEEKKMKNKLKCASCKSPVGSQLLKFKPSFCAFSCDKSIKLLNKTFYNNEKWYKIYQEFCDSIIQRDNSNIEGFLEVKKLLNPREEEIADASLKFPNEQQVDFQWEDLLATKKPRSYQIEAFVRSLLTNLIVVLETGAGKTLIAAMFLKRMIEINDKHMGLLIVDRVPLVYQQAHAIEDDTNLATAAIHGGDNIRTARTLKKLNGGFYNVLVITAGAFKEMISNKLLKVDRFCAVVLDECHHTKGGHDYVKVLKLFTDRNTMMQPQILGLTASPINASTNKNLDNQLGVFLQQFPDTSIFYPELPESKSWEEICKVLDQTEEQKCLTKLLIRKFNDDLRGKISQFVHFDVERDIPKLLPQQSNHAQIVGLLRSLEREFVSHEKDNSKELKEYITDSLIIIECLDICRIMGVHFALQVLKQSQKTQFCSIADDFEKCINVLPNELEMHISQRLLQLKMDLKEQQCSNILVFVSTRYIAKMLTDYLAKEYKELNVQRIVGQGGYDGQDWDEQKRILDDFRDGGSKLLVSTSVLEEGLDVPSCDLVICFTGVLSLIRFIQSRGRARKVGSKFIIYQDNITSEGDLKNLKRQEEVMKTAVKAKENSVISQKADSIIERIKRKEFNDEDEENLMQDGKKLGDEKCDFSFLVYVDKYDFDFKEVKIKLQESLQQCLKEYDFELNRLDILHSDQDVNSITKNVFSKDALVFLAGAKYQSKIRSKTPIEMYSKFCCSFTFQLELGKQKLQLWTEGKFHLVPDDFKEEFEVKCMRIGYYKDKASFYGKHNVRIQSLNLIFKEKTLFISYKLAEKEITVTIPKISIGNFALLSVKKDHFMLCFHLSYPPILQKSQNGSTFSRLTALDYDDIEEVDFSKYPVLYLEFDRCHIHSLLARFPVPIFNVCLKVLGEDSITASQTYRSLDAEDIGWSLKCLEDSRLMCFPKTAKDFVANYLKSQSSLHKLIEKVARKCCYSWDHSYFHGFESLFKEIYKIYSDIPLIILDIATSENTFLIKSVIVSPLRVIAMPAVPVASNRLLRKYACLYKIIIVSFKEEDKSKLLDSSDSSLLQRIQDCIINGIDLCGTKFFFLCATASQLREHKAYFIATHDNNTLLDIRNVIIPKPEDLDPSKYLSRLGMYGTADKYALDLSRDQISWKIDDLRATDDDLVTDGAGKISFEMAKNVSDKIGLVDVPSAFQIRYSGVKGILVTTNENLDVELNKKPVAIRKSMIKFENSDESLSVVNTSKFYPLTLNREIINLLSSVPGDWQYRFNNTLKQYQENELQKMADLFTNAKSAKAELQNFFFGSFINDLLESKMEILDESYWFSVLQGIYRLRIRQIQSKANIPIKEGCLIMGIPDPYGILKEDEVFVQTKINERVDIKKGPLLIFRNPCLHPGDVRRVKGIEAEELKDLVNVVVFPVKDCKMSLAAQCSGGDVDGDKYGVIWDQDLIPPLEGIHKPCIYKDLGNYKKHSLKTDINNKEQLAEFFIKFISNDCLGRIANKHLALCDQLGLGARDPIAIELSKAQAQAVDFPKTGIKPDVPDEALKVTSFPDFMEKTNSETYSSEKILGKLYRRCQSVVYDFDDTSTYCLDHSQNMHLIVEGYDKYFEDATKMYISYEHHMQILMNRFDFKVEVDVILGEATYKWSKHFDADKGKASNVISAQYKSIVNKFRKIFFHDVDDEELKWKKASAWYQVVNDPSSKIVKENKIIFKSFPWVVHDILCQIQKNKKQIQPSKRLIRIGESAIQVFKKEIHKNHLIKNVKEKKDIVDVIRQTIEEFVNKCIIKESSIQLTKGFLVDLYGSTSIFVCEPDSDIDICIRVKQSEGLPEKYLLKSVILNAVESIGAEVEYVDADVPILKGFYEDGNKTTDIDISMNKNGLLKTFYIHHLYEQEENGRLYLPLFWILVKWARVSGIVKSHLDKIVILDTADFYALIIHVLKMPYMEKEKESTISFEKLFKKLEEPFKPEDYYFIGDKIFEFFRKCSLLEVTNLKVEWKTPGIKSVVINASALESIQRYSKKAFHSLSATRDVNTLLEYFMKSSNNTYKKLLPLSLSCEIGIACEFHATRLSKLTGAYVTLKTESDKKILLCGKGSRLVIEKLRSEVQSLLHTNKALVLGRLPQKSSRYFMEGSSILLSRYCSDKSALVSFENSLGPYHLHVQTKERSAIHLSNGYLEDHNNWKSNAFEKLRSHISKQMERFPNDDDEKNLINSIEITVRFGCFYVLNRSITLPKTMLSITLQELESSLEKGRSGRKDWERVEYKIQDDDIQPRAKVSCLETASFTSVPLPPISKQTANKDFKKYPKKQQLNTKRRIKATFSPGLFKNNTNDAEPLEKVLNTFHKTLDKCHFKPGKRLSRMEPATWKACINPCSSFEGNVSMDKDLNILNVSERCLNWVHGTIIDGKEQSFNGDLLINPDIRLFISTEDPLNEIKNKELYKQCVPGGCPPIKIVNDKPKSNDQSNMRENSKKSKKSLVRFVRNVKKLEMFTDGITDASVVQGEIYFGDKLSEHQAFCDISLYFDPTPLINAIKNHLDDDMMNDFVKDVFDKSILVKETLDESLKGVEAEQMDC